MTRVRIGRDGRVEARAVLHLPMPTGVAWGQLRNFVKYASHDYFHVNISIEGNHPCRGARLKLCHRYMAVEVQRVGRILRWEEWSADSARAGFSFSDLSARGPRHGFPHVLTYDLRPDGDSAASLAIIVRGRWTARRVPRVLVRLWLWWVFSHVVSSARNALLTVALHHRATLQ